MADRHIFVVGHDPFNQAFLSRLPQADFCTFHTALDITDIRHVESLDIPGLIEKASKRIESFRGPVHGIVSYYDFPATLLAALLATRFDLPGPSLEAVLKCENKYWSRLVQKECVPEYIPQFQVFNPADPKAYAKIGLMPPFWVKPIKSFRSFLAFEIIDAHQFENAMGICQSKENFLSEPFKILMGMCRPPCPFADMEETFLAETSIGGGAQCTLEGYVYHGQVSLYGTIDSVREPDRSTFSRYEYPSCLPEGVIKRMQAIARTVVHACGLDNAVFNIEFFYDQTADAIWLLEINPRISQSHANLFEKVHGVSHHSVMLDVALGQRPRPIEHDRGPYQKAANFMLRTHTPGRIYRTPSGEDIERLLRQQPDTLLRINVREGQHLSELENQDMYSYELATLTIGGQDQEDLLRQYDQALELLPFDIRPDPVISPFA
ncbi:MAG: ATP-grasp domain-containing protein [Thermodesulfobacteriota bacterium]